jgi:Caspase domain
MAKTYLTIKRIGFISCLLLLLSGSVHAQLKECATLYKEYKDNRTSNPNLAYESAKQFLRRCPNTDRDLKKWIDAYEKDAMAPPTQQTEPVKNIATPLPANAEQNASLVNVAVGRYHALVIGNNTYSHVSNLKTAVADARAIESTLRQHFGFETKLLLNATRQDVFQAISYYRQNAGAADNLLVYYAGHGHFDRDAEKAYWLPVDARREDAANWISADDITSNLRAVPAKHILIVSDSCYSGTIYRGLEIAATERSERNRFLQKMLSAKSRTLMASGGNEPVSDGGGDGHSVFGRVFLNGLVQMEKSTFTASELFREFVQERVAGNANQTPEYNPLRNSGHEGGDFVFIRTTGQKQPPSKVP